MDTATDESEGVVSVDQGGLSDASELERRLRRQWGRADGMSEPDVAYHDTPHDNPALIDHDAIPRSVDILGFGSHYLSKMSHAAHALVHGELFDDPEVRRAALEAEKLAGAQNGANPRLDAYSDGGVKGAHGHFARCSQFPSPSSALTIFVT